MKLFILVMSRVSPRLYFLNHTFFPEDLSLMKTIMVDMKIERRY